MKRLSLRKLAILSACILAALAILAGCERPDPQETAVQVPTQTALPPPTAQPLPTQAPVQVYVVIAQPTGLPQQPVADGGVQVVVTATPVTVVEVTPVVETIELQTEVQPTALPENYYMGWAWSDSLLKNNNLTTVDVGGIILRDRPSIDGRSVGIVMGFADVFVVGDSRCGYEPVIVHGAYMLSRTTPPLEIFPPDPVPTELPPFYSTPIPRSNTTSGWAYTDELTILGETAISGPLGVNLREDPCWGGANLGFIPAGSDLIVLGFPSGDYTPVRVNNDVLQLPFDLLPIQNRRGVIGVDDNEKPGDVGLSVAPGTPIVGSATPIATTAP